MHDIISLSIQMLIHTSRKFYRYDNLIIIKSIAKQHLSINQKSFNMVTTTIDVETEKETWNKNYDPKVLVEKIGTGDHEKILKWIREEKLCLQSYEKDTDNPKTLMRQILEEAGNGHEIIEAILNSYVTQAKPGEKLTSNSYGVKLDFSGITSENSQGEQESVISDLLQLWLSHQSDPWDLITSTVKEAIAWCKKRKIEKVKRCPGTFLGK